METVDGSASPGSEQRWRPRLFIKEMVMRNFKSYAGQQRVGPFHKSFTAVVGPNGSGKSNVIDAMLFIFGKQAKQMRLNKVSELFTILLIIRIWIVLVFLFIFRRLLIWMMGHMKLFWEVILLLHVLPSVITPQNTTLMTAKVILLMLLRN